MGMHELLEKYVQKFNEQDEELTVQHISNKDAYGWMKEQIPYFECSDKEVEETYYFRWWVYRKHVKETPEGYIITEFLPDVYWVGKYNSINCVAGHHIYEGRWLRNGDTYLKDYIQFWVKGSGNVRSYITWIVDAIYQFCLIKGDFQMAVDLLPHMTENYEQWEKEHLHESGLFWSIDDRDAMEYSISGNGLRPALNSYLYADAIAISKIADLAGDHLCAEKYRQKAERIRQLVQERLWDQAVEFFKVIPLEKKKDAVQQWDFSQIETNHNVREEIGFIQWCFHLPDAGYEKAWKQITDKEGFAAPYGPTTAEQRHPRYNYEQSDHECLWNGPSWPFATTQTLSAMANVIKDYHQPYVTKEDFYHVFSGYTHSHYRTLENGKKVNWLDENLDPYTGEWLSRRILKDWEWRKDKGGYERGKDYNHSAYADLVISKIFGVEPQETGEIRIRPMLPDEWSYCRLQKIKCQGKDLDIIYDKTGEKYHQGKGFQVWCDGECIHKSLYPEEISF